MVKSRSGSVACMLAVLALGVGVLTGCAPAALPTVHDLVGTWVVSESPARIVLRSDMTCTVTDVPTDVITTSGFGGVDYSSECVWGLGDGYGRARRTDGTPLMYVDFPVEPLPPASGTVLGVRGSGEGLTIEVQLGDPDSDDYFTFHRAR